MGGQRDAPAALPPGKTRYLLHRRLSGPQGRSGRVQETSTPTGIRSLDRPDRNESLYRLHFPGPLMLISVFDTDCNGDSAAGGDRYGDVLRKIRENFSIF